MIQRIKAVLDDERGVSPVIGVILMVAITVILAAVIGTFVLGLGDSLNQAPQAQLDAEGDGADIVLSHNGGDALTPGDIEMSFSSNFNPGQTLNDAYDGDGDFGVGSSATFSDAEPSDDVDVQVIHTPSDSIIFETTVSF